MEQKISDPRLVLKATAPRASRALLYRARLGLNSGNQADRSVLALQAPAGYGKSSLLLQWRREALESGAIVAWLTLDEHDDDASFARGLNVALSTGSGNGQFVHQSPDPGITPADGMEALTVWLAEVASMAVEVALILDDAHALPVATATSSLMYLLLNAPSNLRIVLACRRPLDLNFVDLLTSGRLLQLRADDLALTMEETVELLETSLGEGIDPDACVRLYELTEGWPLGVQLAMSSVLKSANRRDALAGFSAPSGDLHHYFMQCLVDSLPDESVAVLTDVSCLDRIHPQLCRAMTANEESPALLAYLHDQTPLFRDEVDGEWMRIQPIAREFLDERFGRLPPEHRVVLHARATQWLTDHEMFEEAADHALLAGEREVAYDLVERCLYVILNQGRMSRVLDWIERLPPEEIARRPQVRIATAWALAHSERHGEAAELVGSVMDDPQTGEAERCEAAAICAAAAFFDDDFEPLLAFVARWQDALAALPTFQQIIGTNLIAAVALFQGKPESANYHLERLRNIPHSPELSYALGWSSWFSGFAYLWEGQAALAEDVLRPALSRAEEVSGRRSPIAVMLAATLAAVLWERERFDEARLLLAGRLDILERHAPPDAIVHGYLTAARLAAEGGASERAHDLIEHLRAIGDARDLPRLCMASLAEKIRMLALSNQEAACAARLDRLEQIDRARAAGWGVLQPLVAMQIGIARAYTAIAGHRWDLALPELDAVDPVGKRARLVRELLQVHLLRALARQQGGDDVSAVIREAASLADTLGLRRLLLDTYPAYAEACPAATVEPAPVSSTAHVATPPSTNSGAHVIDNVLLTPKETEILQLVAANLSNKKIASAMDVSSETIKWHMKNMFSKLQAGSRQHLIGRARMLGILE